MISKSAFVRHSLNNAKLFATIASEAQIPPCAEFIEALFGRLTLCYGRAFLARWKGLDLEAVKADWVRELANYAQRPDAIEHALVLLDPADPPTAAAFREVCASVCAGSGFPGTARGEAAAACRRDPAQLPAPGGALQVGRERAWAAGMVQRADAGEWVSGYNFHGLFDGIHHYKILLAL